MAVQFQSIKEIVLMWTWLCNDGQGSTWNCQSDDVPVPQTTTFTQQELFSIVACCTMIMHTICGHSVWCTNARKSERCSKWEISKSNTRLCMNPTIHINASYTPHSSTMHISLTSSLVPTFDQHLCAWLMWLFCQIWSEPLSSPSPA